MRLKSALRRGVAAAVIAGIVVSSGIPAYAARGTSPTATSP